MTLMAHKSPQKQNKTQWTKKRTSPTDYWIVKWASNNHNHRKFVK